MKALLAEKDAMTRREVQSVLSRRGWQVSVAADGAEAAALFQRSPFPLVILGDDLPEGGASEVCAAIRTSRPGRAAFVVAITVPTAAAAQRLVAAGVDDFVARPVDAAHFESRLLFAEAQLFPTGDDAPGPTAESYPQRIAQLEERLRVQRASLEELFNSAPEGLVVVDARDRIVRVNGEFTRMFGYTADEALGSSVHDLIVPEPLREEARETMRGVKRGERVTLETVRCHRDGHLIDVSVLATPIQVGRGHVGSYGIYRDITGRRRQEEALRESEARYRAEAAELERVNAALREGTLELQAAMQARNRLYTAMNHELRTPISAVMLHQELILSGALGPLAPDQREAMEHSHTAARHLLELVRDVLDLSKLEAGKVSVVPVEVPLGSLLRDLRDTAHPLAGRFGSRLDLLLPDDEPTVVTDPQRVRQILLNFLSNAAKFGRGEPIALHCGRSAAGEVVVEVVDRGIGIPTAELPRIFEDFVQIGNNADGGTGLGLAISRRLARLLGGRLEVESEPGLGSTFRLVLPLAASRPMPLPEPTP